jgi:hypothetical protein
VAVDPEQACQPLVVADDLGRALQDLSLQMADAARTWVAFRRARGENYSWPRRSTS